MKNGSKKKSASPPVPDTSEDFPLGVLALIIATVMGVAIGAAIWLRPAQPSFGPTYAARAKGEITFNKHIAPIIFQNCSGCHRSGQSAPFTLLNYQDVRKRASDIVTVTQSRYMPPWLPEPGHGRFLGERRLTADQIGMIKQWADEGAAEGNPADLPTAPSWDSDWQLGKPDLVVRMPEPYQLAAEGTDVYRNFVLPVPITNTCYVRAVEFRPGNPRIVHHTFIKVDRSKKSRRLDERDTEVGFPGLIVPAEIPDGHFLGWQPGRMPSPLPDGLPFRLDPGNDFVLQMHLSRSGKPEQLQSSIGLFFTDRPPTNTCFRLSLTSYLIDIPAGASDYVVEDSFVMPVDTHVLAVLPHAHYLAKEMKGWAALPNGRQIPLLSIKQWNFNWQSDYWYAEPVFLPRGSTLFMRYTYDNSTNNVRNPNHPPKAVTYGPQSSDEMAELWFQLLPTDAKDIPVLEREYQAKITRLVLKQNEVLLKKNPDDAKALAEMGLIRISQRNWREAEQLLRRAVKSEPDHAMAHYNLGVLLRLQNRIEEAQQEFETVARLDPEDSKAHGNLGFICFDQGKLDLAQKHFENALRLNPDDDIAQSGLEEIRRARASR